MSTLITVSAEETINAGISVGSKLVPGSVIALRGTLGAGKTTFVKGIARKLEISDVITSPTFTIISEYYGKLPLYHMDLYRIDSEEEFELLGIDEMIYGKGVSVIEWSEKAENILPDNHIKIDIEIKENNSRVISIDGISI